MQSPLVFTLVSFALILVLARLRVPLAGAVLAGAFAVGLLFKLTPLDLAMTSLAGVILPKTLSLAIITALLLWLSGLMRASGQFEEIVSLARALLRRPGLTMAALPALVGLLPMPGGALFSAPMVQSAAGEHRVPGSALSAINYWYRHIWEHWWPLYPGVVLALTLTEDEYLHFAMYQIPLGLIMATTGLLLFRGLHGDLHHKAAPPPPGTKRKLLWATSPVWVIVLVWIAARLLLEHGVKPLLSEPAREHLEHYAKYLPLIVGLVASVAWTTRTRGLSARTVASTLCEWSVGRLVLMVVAVMIFQHVLGRAKAAEEIAAELQDYHVPIVIVVVALPYVAGLVTGLAIGFVGTSFPIVLALASASGDPGMVRVCIVLAYAFGHLGQMTSPLHLCQIVSNDFFSTSFGPVYRRFLPSALLNAVLVAAYVGLLWLVL
jgi:uncharacterized protein